MSNTFITTTIPYVNAKPHIGFTLELVQADTLARYARLCGNRVRFQTGTDENAWKNVESVRAQGCSPQEFVTHNTEAFRQLGHALNTSVDAPPQCGRLLATAVPAGEQRARGGRAISESGPCQCTIVSTVGRPVRW